VTDPYSELPTEPPARRNPYLIAGIVLIAFVFFAGIFAAITFRQRVGSAGSAWTPPAVTTTPGTPAAVAQATAVAAPTGAAAAGTPTLTTTVQATATATASASPTPTPTEPPACTSDVAPDLAPLYSLAELGCARGPASVVWAAWEPFERGAMFWRSDTDEAYVLLNDGRWLPITEPWNGEPPAGRGSAPSGLVAPERGFGWVWSTRDDVFQALGWATDREKGFCALLQPFERGFLLRSSGGASCTADELYNFATEPGWRPLALAVHATGWRSANIGALGGLRPPASGPASTVARPAGQGRLTARPLAATLDADFSEWPGDWQPLNALVHGREEWSGAGDLAARFQVAWSPDGLYLALEVTDDAYRAGPQNTDMWQGDGLELNFDRDLAGDLADPSSSADDYQIGLGYGPQAASPRGYRWLPYARESALDISAAVALGTTGYRVEALVPWSAFDMTAGEAAAAAAAGTPFGFTLAVNDNDGGTPSQQTVLASSPARTTHDNPTQWGTLILGN
jgi:hypothetical protein